MSELIEKFAAGLFIVIPLIWIVSYIYSRHSKGWSKGQKGFMKVVSNMPIGPKKTISVVNVAGEYLVLGVSADQVNYLTTIDDVDTVERIEEHARKEDLAGIKKLLTLKKNPLGDNLKRVFNLKGLGLKSFKK